MVKKIFAKKMVGQFAPELLGQFNWIVQMGNSFKKMHANGDNKLLMTDVFEDENLEEWS